MKIVLSQKEFVDLKEYVEWKVNNPCPCGNCIIANSCTGCPEQIEWNQKRLSFNGYSLYCKDGVLPLSKAYEDEYRKRLEFMRIGKEYMDAQDAYNAVVDQFEIQWGENT